MPFPQQKNISTTRGLEDGKEWHHVRLHLLMIGLKILNDEHEYAVLGGFNRSQIGRYLATASAIIAGTVVYLLLLAVDIAKRFGFQQNIPPSVLSLVGASTVYLLLYWIFSRYIWKLPILAGFLKVPNLSGTWICDGQTINPDKTLGYVWTGKVTIVQNWDKIRVRLKTSQSGSSSITAALAYDETDGCRLLYNYINDPKIGELDLKSHRGFADMIFDTNFKSADGGYFNGHGRFTFGTMKWTKEGI